MIHIIEFNNIWFVSHWPFGESIMASWVRTFGYLFNAWIITTVKLRTKDLHDTSSLKWARLIISGFLKNYRVKCLQIKCIAWAFSFWKVTNILFSFLIDCRMEWYTRFHCNPCQVHSTSHIFPHTKKSDVHRHNNFSKPLPHTFFVIMLYW